MIMVFNRSYRYVLVLGLLACGVACSSAQTERTGPLSSGTPSPQTGNSSGSDAPTGGNVPPPSDIIQPPTLPSPTPVCGNGKMETGEACDDSNVLDGDGCNSICKIESCGDGVIQVVLGEDCEGANLNENSCVKLGYTSGNLSCSDCKFVNADCSSICGNGKMETGEACDDGNLKNGDGCDVICKLEATPTIQTNFSTSDGFIIKKKQPLGSITFGEPSADTPDGKVVSLMFPGDPALGPSDNKSTKYATEIATQESLHFGTYRTRVKFAECDSTEEVVNGIFLYSYGGDTNGNGITDNNEIDFEILCGEPKYLWMTTWTDYPDVGEVGSERHVSHVINMETGSFYQSDPANGDKFSKLGSNSEFIVPGFATSGKYYEIGFEWSSDHIRFFMEKDGKDVTLWDYSDTPDKTQTYIPQNPATFRYNVWHTGSHWWVGGDADYPSGNVVMDVDWFKYWAN